MLALGGWLLCPALGCPRAAGRQTAGGVDSSSAPATGEPGRRRSTYAERVKQGRDLRRLTPRRKALNRALSLQDPAEQLAATRHELLRLREERILFALRRHEESPPLTLAEAESLREGVRAEQGRPTLAVVIELRLGIENEIPLQITARELYRPTYELLVEHLREELARKQGRSPTSSPAEERGR